MKKLDIKNIPTNQLREMIESLKDKYDEYSNMVMEWILDEYEIRVNEEDFIKLCKTL